MIHSWKIDTFLEDLYNLGRLIQSRKIDTFWKIYKFLEDLYKFLED